MVVTDEEAAALAITNLSCVTDKQIETQRQIEAILGNGDEDSLVDIQQLFKLYDILYFRSLLATRVEVLWSERLTLCAGICEINKGNIRIKLSSALLKFRPRSDILNTFLHECIHAYFFITSRSHHIRDPTGGHGEGFQTLSTAINEHGGYEITEFHTFYNEIDIYRTHVWQCNGSCAERPPFFGLVKRAMNRPPSKMDDWWGKHEVECGGNFVKIGEPSKTKKQLDAMSAKQRAGLQKNKIDGWLKKRPRSPPEENEHAIKMVLCPICSKSINSNVINEHLDAQHDL